MARGYTRYLSNFSCQASAVIVADTVSGGGTIEFNTVASGNCDGCEDAEIEIDVTSAPATAARCEVYMRPLEHDGAGNSADKLMGSIAIATSADKYIVKIRDLSEKGNIVIKAIDFGFTASASMRGQYPSDT